MSAYEKGVLVSAHPTKAQLNAFREAARATFIKSRRVNIRLFAADLLDIQAKAYEAYGEAQEHGLLIPMLEGVREHFSALGAADVLEQVAVAAGSGLHSEANVRYLFETGVDGYTP